MINEIKCLNCGSPLIEKGDKYFCEYCGCEYSDEEVSNVINNYGTANIVINNISNGDALKAEEYINNAEKNIDINNYDAAIEILDEAVKLYADNYKIWMLYVRVMTENYTKIFDKTHEPYLEKAKMVANENEKRKIMEEYSPYIQKRNAELSKESTQEETRKSMVGVFVAFAVLLCIIAVIIASAR